jgi:hypothetical protein
MKSLSPGTGLRISILFTFILLLLNKQSFSQDIRFGIFADPVISWFSSDTKETKNDGARAGGNFGVTFHKYFSKNYSFSTGISILNAGGKLYNTDTINMAFNNFSTEVPSGRTVVYRIQYIDVPLGLKFESNQIGYVTFFSDLGIDPKFVIGGKADIPSAGIKSEAAINELKKINLSYHSLAGIEYSLGGSTGIIFGLGFEKNFLDVTKDINMQPEDKVSLNILKFRIGVNF